jgi:hypothetical protein
VVQESEGQPPVSSELAKITTRGRKAADERWKAMAILGAWLDANGIPERQADAEEFLKQWFEDQKLNCSDSYARKLVTLAIEALQERE